MAENALVPARIAPADPGRRRTLVAAGALCALLLVGCATPPVPDSKPAPAIPEAWLRAPTEPGWVPAEQARQWEQGQWWRWFDDATLNALMDRAEAANQDLRVAAANLARAQAVLREQASGLWPRLNLQAGDSRSGGDRGGSRSANLGLNASWAPDLWGRVDAELAAQRSSVQASRADLAGVRLTVQSELALAYLSLRASEAELRLLDASIAGYERAAQITQNRYDVGLVARTDTLQAQQTLHSAQASRLATQRSRSLYQHAIARLVGQAPADFSLPDGPWVEAVPQVPVELPSLLLLRRPDLASAERAVAAANARVGVARSAYFPEFSISASLGASAGRVDQLLSAPALLWSLGLALTQPLFDAGARDARLEQAVATRDAAVASYRQASLTAFKEVEDQLATLATLEQEAAEAAAAAQAAQRIEQQMLNRYNAGLSIYTEVVSAQNSAISARRSVLQLGLQRQQAVVALVRALGGGWQAPWLTPAS